MEQTRTLGDKFWLFLKGLSMGAANKVPGVSGGIVAFVAGFYEEFIFSLQRFNKKAVTLLFRGKFRSLYSYVNGKFLSILILGMLVSYFSVSKILDYLLIHYELYVWSLFFGMIIGSIYYIYKDFKSWNYNRFFALIIGALIGIGISFLDPAKENDNLWFVFFCGMVSVAGMTLPGFSGSFILILLGNYVLLLVDAVNALFDTFSDIFSGDFEFLRDESRVRMLQVLAVFTLGSVVGLVSLSHLLTFILKKYRDITIATIIGFIIGSLGVVWPWKHTVFRKNEQGAFVIDSTGKYVVENYTRYFPNLTTETILAIIFIITGIVFILILAWYGEKTKLKNARIRTNR